MNTAVYRMNLASEIVPNLSAYKNTVLMGMRPGSMKEYSRLAIMVACSYQSTRERHRGSDEKSLLRNVYLQRLQEIMRLYPLPAFRPRGYEDVENPAHIDRVLANSSDLPSLIRQIIVEQFPEIPLHHTFDDGNTLNEELDRIIGNVINTYVPAYGGGNPACTAENYNAVA